jgi:DNA replication and repair protein RecF
VRTLTELNVHHLRSIESTRLTLHPHFNLFYGPNGSGKTSLLEAIYLLSSGHSFRTREISPLVSEGESSLIVFARTSTDESISIQKSISGPTQVKLNRQVCYSSSELAHFLPCQVFYQDIFQIIDAGPSVRRTLLDWGLFHVEQSYHSIWKSYRAVIKQRNALLRQKAPAQAFIPWNKQLVELAVELDRMRSGYFMQWSQQFHEFLQQLTDVPCVISYYKGWDRKQTGKDLAAILDEQLTTDLHRQYTHAGAHQADILFDLSSKKAKLLLSRGQQKIVLIALKLAQASLVPGNCIYLLDDIAAELDTQHLSRLIDCLRKIKGQLFLTALDNVTFQAFSQNNEIKAYAIKDGIFELV